jgi:hypothetical protein
LPDQIEEFVPNAQACRELGITEMTAWRWDNVPGAAPQGWPIKIKRGEKLQSRTYRLRSELEACKANLLRQAVEANKARSPEAAA